MKFYLPDGSRTDVVALSLPCFFARTPEDFLEFTRARKPDPETGQPDFGKIGDWLEAHPEAGPAIQAAVTADPPESYATVVYNSIHSFRLTAPDGTERFVRYRFEPEAGESHALRGGRQGTRARLPPGGDRRARLDRLPDGRRDRRRRATPSNDPTVAWPEERERVELGPARAGRPRHRARAATATSSSSTPPASQTAST